MLIIFHLLLMFRVGRFTDDVILETKTVGVGDNVKLTCTHENLGNLFWIRLVSGNLPEVLGKSFSFENVGSRIRTSEEPRTFVLRIKSVELSDAALYYCLKIRQKLSFLKGAHLSVEGPKPHITTVPPSDPVRPADSVTLQSSVPPENKKFVEEHSVCYFESGSQQSYPSFSYAKGNHEGISKKKCVYSFSKNVSSSDAGTYYCAVATCGEILFGNGTKLDTEVNTCESQRDGTFVSLLCAALAVSLMVIAFLIYSIKKLKEQSCGCCNADVALQNTVTASADCQSSEQTEEYSLIYSAPTFTSRRAGKSETKDVPTVEEESIYTEVRALELD
uniref:uncharacterized protein LOC124067950 isoform X5 n=1 Tax=Scatophagus argus TaxID=75038 RepID=UPI001ED7CECD|nr:uncharacterized protein LOC124067950 isoform X5 [Scatophagus argus]